MSANEPTRKAPAGATVSYTTGDGQTVTVRATSKGRIRARHPEGDAVLDSMGYQVDAKVEPEEEGTD